MNVAIKILLFLMAIVLIVGFIDVASAQSQTLGTFLKDGCVELKQTCGNCTYVNLSRVSAPDSTILLSGQKAMTKTDTVYNYTFCSTSQIGEYIVDWKADPNGITTAGNYDFFISLTGMQPSTAQGTIYFFLGLLSLFIFALSLYGSIKIPWKHPRNQQGQIIGINDLKYLKLLLWFFTYLMIIFITFAFRHVGKIANWEVASNWFNFMFWFLIVFLLPIFIMTLIMGIVSFFDAKKIDRLMLRGFKPR